MADNVITNQILDKESRNLLRQHAALGQTLAAITMLEAAEKKTPGSFGPAIAKLKVKRDRQHKNALATESYINALHENLTPSTGTRGSKYSSKNTPRGAEDPRPA